DAVLEQGIDSEVPFYVNNLQSYQFEYRRVGADGAQENNSFTRDVPKVEDVQFAVPFGLREMLDGKSGALFGWLRTTPDVAGRNAQRFFAQVTPYQVHVKLGHFSSLAWVTDMQTGDTVEGAKVQVYPQAFTALGLPGEMLAESVTDASGVAVLPGAETLDPALTVLEHYRDEEEHFFVRVVKGEAQALLPLTYAFNINAWRASGSYSVYPSAKERYGHMRSWGTTAQGIYRAGDTIQYKLYVRNQDDRGYTPAPSKGYRLKIIDPMGKAVHEEKEVVLSEFGGFSGEFTVPKTGAVGWYQFKLIADFARRSDTDYDEAQEHEVMGDDGRADEQAETPDKDVKTFVPMRVLVSDFTPSPFRVRNQLNGDRFRAGELVEVKTFAELHSGGAYTDASARVTAVLEPGAFLPKYPAAEGF
ncbi:MAG: hypothetical protein K2Q01_04970, partial [Rickettsiales bacterium]|nr:hypothetical protein [Rickettsiales bacterium]